MAIKKQEDIKLLKDKNILTFEIKANMTEH